MFGNVSKHFSTDLRVDYGINEAELAMRDEPDVELRCQTIRSSDPQKVLIS